MGSKTRYRCEYCGTDFVRDTLALYALKMLRCKVCNHSKFKTKPVEDGSNNCYGYDKEKPVIDFGFED